MIIEKILIVFLMEFIISEINVMDITVTALSMKAHYLF